MTAARKLTAAVCRLRLLNMNDVRLIAVNGNPADTDFYPGAGRCRVAAFSGPQGGLRLQQSALRVVVTLTRHGSIE
jgi:hypothetical protein